MASTCAAAVLFLLSVIQQVDSRSILDFSLEVRKSNVVRITRSECEECVTLEGFKQNNSRGFFLIHERNLVSHHHYKGAIVAGFYEVCKSLRFSHVPCGVVDIMEDKAYAELYVDPKTAPAHIALKDGEAQPTKKEWVEKLMAQPGDKATMLWHLKQQLIPNEDLRALDISAEVTEADAFEQLISRYEVVVAANCGGNSNRPASAGFRAAAQELVLLGEVNINLQQPPGSGSRKPKKSKKGTEPRVLFVALGKDQAANNTFKRGEVVTFVKGKLQTKRSAIPIAKANKDEDAFRQVCKEAIKAVLPAALQEHSSLQDVSAASPQDTKADKKKSKRNDFTEL